MKSVRVTRTLGEAVIDAARRTFPALEAAATSTTKAHSRNGTLPHPRAVITRSKFEGVDFQSNIAFQLARVLRQPPHEIATAIGTELQSGIENSDRQPLGDAHGVIESVDVSGNGFLNIALNPQWLSQCANVLNSNLDSTNGQALEDHATTSTKRQRVLVDFASPNMCKALHIGHLRSAIIGDSICRVLEFQGHSVDRVSHVGDWGTPMAIVLTHLQQSEHHKHWLSSLALSELQSEDCVLPIDADVLGQEYAAAKQRYDSDAEFAKIVHTNVQELQQSSASDEEAIGTLRHNWALVCEVSRRSFQKLFKQLGVTGLVERGESMYSAMLPEVVADLRNASQRELGEHQSASDTLVFKESDGAQCIFIDGPEKPPTIVQKKDGSYLYATTDLAALRHRLDQGYDRVLYVVDHAQSWHFEQVFEIARRAGWWNPDTVEVRHIPFGLILGEDGRKMSSRDGGTPLLADLLQQSYEAALSHTMARDAGSTHALAGGEVDLSTATDSQREVARTLGAGALRFFDLSHGMSTDYSFSVDALMSVDGGRSNSCVRILYAYGRLTQLLNASQTASTEESSTMFDVQHELVEECSDAERDMLLHIAMFPDVIDQVSSTYQLNGLCEYLFTTATCFHRFYGTERILGHHRQAFRLEICKAARSVLGAGLQLVGVATLDRV